LGAANGCGEPELVADDGLKNRALLLALPENADDDVAADTVPYFPALRLYVAPIEDAREDRARIGEEEDAAPPKSVVASGMAPTDFVAAMLAKQLAAAGIRPVDREEQANRILRVRLVTFFTREETLRGGPETGHGSPASFATAPRSAPS
jgi:hypothetical protein